MILPLCLLSEVLHYACYLQVSERLGYSHISQGEGESRFIMVRKPDKSARSVSINTASAQAASERSDVPKPKKDAPKHNEKMPQATQDSESKAHESANENKLKTQTLVEVSDTDKLTDNESESDSQTVVCSKCGKDILTGNMQLHELRCQGALTSGAPTSGAKPKTKNKKKAKKEAQPAEDTEDFDALIAAAMKENTTCAFDKCKTLTATLGMNCEFCARRFCLSHHIPEIHGCGDAARGKARHTTIKAGVVYRGSGVPDKKPDPVKRAHLERKLEKKLNELTDKRSTKTKDKK